MAQTSDHSALPSLEALQLAQRLRLSTDRLRRLVRAAGAEGELTRTQEAVLSLLSRHGPTTTADLAKRESLRPQSMGAVVAGLLDAGLVEKSPHPRDRRRELVSLTGEGRAETARTALLRTQDLARLFDAQLSVEDRHTLARTLSLLESLTLPENRA